MGGVLKCYGVGMATEPAVSGGLVPAYLNKKQMNALLRLADSKGLSKAQIAKEAVVRHLVNEGVLSPLELEPVLTKQKMLQEDPYPNKKERYLPVEEAEPVRPARRRRRRTMGA